MLLTRLNVKEMSGKDNLLTIIEELKIKKICRKLFKFSMFNNYNVFFLLYNILWLSNIN